MPSLYPRMLSQLRHLRRLSIKCKVPEDETLPQCSLEIQKLPETLEELYLEGNPFILNYSPAWQRSSPQYLLTEYEHGNSRFIPLGKCFPKLHTLQLKHFDFLDLLPGDLAALPSTLTLFRTNRISSDSLQHYAHLPSSLLRLEAIIYFADNRALCDQWFATLPPNLQYIKLLRRFPPGAIPQSLTGHCFESYLWNRESASFIPPLFESLDLTISVQHGDLITGEWVDYLPKALAKLTVHTYDEVYPLLGTNIARLPQSITHLTPDSRLSFDWVAIRTHLETYPLIPFWPKNLTVMDLEAAVLSPKDLILLPRSLKKIKSWWLGDEKDIEINASDFPPNLRKLDVDSKHTIIFRNRLPSSLKTIKVYNPIPENLEIMKSMAASSLNSLTTLWLRGVKFFPPKGQIPPLPPNLTDFNAEWPADHLGALPRSITKLKLVLFKLSEAIAADPFFLTMHLPTHLRHFEAVCDPSETNSIVIPAFPVLPHLEVMWVKRLGIFHSVVFMSLPTSLRSLQIVISTVEDEYMKFIPSRLNQLSLAIERESDWTRMSLANNWPVLASKEYNSENPVLLARVQERLEDFSP